MILQVAVPKGWLVSQLHHVDIEKHTADVFYVAFVPRDDGLSSEGMCSPLRYDIKLAKSLDFCHVKDT